jgi:hypothetical protein
LNPTSGAGALAEEFDAIVTATQLKIVSQYTIPIVLVTMCLIRHSAGTFAHAFD